MRILAYLLAFLVCGFVLLLMGFLHAITTEKDEDDKDYEDNEEGWK